MKCFYLLFFLFYLFSTCAQAIQNQGQVIAQGKVQIKLSHQQYLLQPILNYAKSMNSSNKILPKITTLYNYDTHMGSSQICKIVRSKNNKSFKVLDRINHKIKDRDEWQNLIQDQSLIFQLDQINKLVYPIDIHYVNQIIVTIFEDGQIIFYSINQTKPSLQKISSQLVYDQKNNKNLGLGKFITFGNEKNLLFFISGEQIILINIKQFQITILKQYEVSKVFYSALVAVIKQNTHIFICNGQKGINHYIFNNKSNSLIKEKHFHVYLNDSMRIHRLSITQLIDVTQNFKQILGQFVFFGLSSKFGLLKIVLPNIGESDIIYAERTHMKNKNCKFGKLYNEILYFSCPQIVVYNIQENISKINYLSIKNPNQLISNNQQLLIVSQNQFTLLNKCYLSELKGDFQGQKFHYSTIADKMFVSVDQFSITLWTVNQPQYFLQCKGNRKFLGHNYFNISIKSPCQNQINNASMCCQQNIQFNLTIQNSQQNTHILQIVLTIIFIIGAIGSSIVFFMRKNVIKKQYFELQQQHIHARTEQSMIQNQNQQDNRSVQINSIIKQ